MKEFYITPGLPHTYGSRVFLHRDDVKDMLQGTNCFIDQLPHNPSHPIARILRENCLWGGNDKEYDHWYGYEVSSIPETGQVQMGNIVKVLFAEGFTKLTECPW